MRLSEQCETHIVERKKERKKENNRTKLVPSFGARPLTNVIAASDLRDSPSTDDDNDDNDDDDDAANGVDDIVDEPAPGRTTAKKI